MQTSTINEMMMLSKAEQRLLFKQMEKSLKKWKKKKVKQSKHLKRA